MGSINIYQKPNGIIAAHQEGKGDVQVSFSVDCVSLLVSISSDRLYQKEFTGEELFGGSVRFNILKYVQKFSFANKEIYSPAFELVNGYIKNFYSVQIVATFSDGTTQYASFSGLAICSISFGSDKEPAPGETFRLTDNFGNPFTDNRGNYITVTV